MPLFAKIGPDNKVVDIKVGKSADWFAIRLGGAWVETYENHPTQKYAAIGDRYDPSSDAKFM